MGSLFGFPLLLTLVLCSLSIEIACGAPVITIINGLPKDSPPLSMKCRTNVTVTEHHVNAGEVHILTAETNDLYRCFVMWGLKFADFESFDPKRDTRHHEIIWKVKKDGFFLRLGSSSRSPLLLTLVLCSLFIETAHGAPVIIIINSLPKDSPPLSVKCITNLTDIVTGHPVTDIVTGHPVTVGERRNSGRLSGRERGCSDLDRKYSTADSTGLTTDYGQVDFDALEQLENPDIHVDSVRTMNLFRKIKEVLAALDCPKKFILRDLIKPDADMTKLFLSALLNFCIHREDYGQVDFDALEQPENPDLHVDSVRTMNLFRTIKELLAALDCPKKFILRDLIKPNADRTELFLSALLNFFIHRFRFCKKRF
ncbi:hypothetical protein RHSIM_RhsimUnG0234900 [Rhododendron simsii]|uniref:Kinetochore protein Nuf2 N-terminal domain-containing protein n=1 Tax=Rhododendron simsii TaxID=118357 RepID=A0A834L3T4_RHOSS|nr:hypothetical protein RHSIM_RhsimUnG0234900 [Rhododendron simsii]